MGNTRIELLIIDPQNDFCLKPEEGAALSVPGGHDDMKRVADFITKYGNRLADIHVTLDCHHLYDIAHGVFWKDSAGKNPDPFTIITKEDVKSGKWMTTVPSLQAMAARYVDALDKGKRYPLCIWPAHCLIGTTGNAVVKELADALYSWERTEQADIGFITKGSNPFTEHYSAVVAEVQDPENRDPSIAPNARFLDILEGCDKLLITGEASSHCVANTVMDMLKMFPGAIKHTRKIVFLEDASSPVGGFEHLTEAFIKEMTSNGMEISKTTDFFR